MNGFYLSNSYFGQIFGCSFLFGYLGLLRDPTLPAGNIREGLGRGTLNTFCKTQGETLKNGVNVYIWTFVRKSEKSRLQIVIT